MAGGHNRRHTMKFPISLWLCSLASVALAQPLLRTSGFAVRQTLTATNGYYIPTNALSAWPTSARTRGEAYMGNSNGWVYLLTSDGTAGTAWTKTNLIATP